MNILALDLGTKMGWAAKVRSSVASGTVGYHNGRYSGGGMRFLKFRRWLEQTIREQSIQAVYFEEVRRHMSTDAAHVYGGFLSILTSVCEEMKVQYEGIPVGTIKKFATGKGTASKDVMISSAIARFPDQQIEDDNQADALWILAVGCHQLNLPIK